MRASQLIHDELHSSANSPNSTMTKKSGELAANTIQEGKLVRKVVMESRGVKSSNRQWKPVFAALNDSGLYLYKADSNGKLSKEEKLLDFIPCRHLYCSYINGYNEERRHAFSLLTPLGALSYFQCDSEELALKWIDNIHYICAKFSSPALAAAVGSSINFVPPILPSTNTKNTPEQQLAYFEAQSKKFDSDIVEHIQVRDELFESESGKGPETLKKVQNWNQKMDYLNTELKRHLEYASILQKRLQKQPEKIEDKKEKEMKKEDPDTEKAEKIEDKKEKEEKEEKDEKEVEKGKEVEKLERGDE